jgi:hypothetical protein
VTAIVDQEQGALGSTLGLDQDAVISADRLVPVGEQRKRKVAEALGISLMRPDVVDADGEDLHLCLLELRVITSQGGELIRSTRAEVEDVENEQDVLVPLE